MKHLAEIAYDGVQIEHLRLKHLSSAEREELPGQRRGALARALDLLELFSHRVFRVQSTEAQLAVPDDCRQEIIKVVGHAACQSSDAFHFLRVKELILKLLALGDVGNYRDAAVDVASSVRQRRAGYADVDHPAFFRNPRAF